MPRPRSANRPPSAERIIEIRQALGESQEKFAERLGVSKKTVNCWETDYHRPHHYDTVRQLIELDRSNPNGQEEED